MLVRRLSIQPRRSKVMASSDGRNGRRQETQKTGTNSDLERMLAIWRDDFHLVRRDTSALLRLLGKEHRCRLRREINVLSLPAVDMMVDLSEAAVPSLGYKSLRGGLKRKGSSVREHVLRPLR